MPLEFQYRRHSTSASPKPLSECPPTTDTDTTTSPTDNDSEAGVIVSPRLPETGSDTGAFLAVAFGLMAAGGLLLAAARRRRSTQE